MFAIGGPNLLNLVAISDSKLCAAIALPDAPMEE